MAPISQRERKNLEAAKRANMPQLLFKSARLLNEQAVARIRERTGMDIRPAHTSVFPHIDLDGTRLTEIARRMGISKQAVGQLVSDLEEMGTLERVPDPEDGRAKLVRFRRIDGELSIMGGLAVLGEFEAQLRKRLGARSMDQLADLLARLLDALES